jgi:hypothetical protein
MEELPIRLGSEEESRKFWDNYSCCAHCFEDELNNRGYDIVVYEEWKEDDIENPRV